jgi:hypothetical protein
MADLRAHEDSGSAEGAVGRTDFHPWRPRLEPTSLLILHRLVTGFYDLILAACADAGFEPLSGPPFTTPQDTPR